VHGLDPIVRSDILAAIIRTVSDEGGTVFFSSHLLEEIERVSDHVAMLHQGKLVLCGQLDDVKAQHHRITFRFDTQQAEPPAVPGAWSVTGSGREWTIICDPERVAHLAATIVDDDAASLNEIFVAHAGVPLSAAALAQRG
jgi:ABC-2 type transport system ATP-binding protein